MLIWKPSTDEKVLGTWDRNSEVIWLKEEGQWFIDETLALVLAPRRAPLCNFVQWMAGEKSQGTKELLDVTFDPEGRAFEREFIKCNQKKNSIKEGEIQETPCRNLIYINTYTRKQKYMRKSVQWIYIKWSWSSRNALLGCIWSIHTEKLYSSIKKNKINLWALVRKHLSTVCYMKKQVFAKPCVKCKCIFFKCVYTRMSMTRLYGPCNVHMREHLKWCTVVIHG